jgi:hypothetical protein
LASGSEGFKGWIMAVSLKSPDRHAGKSKRDTAALPLPPPA